MMKKQMNWFERGASFSKKYFFWILRDAPQVQRKLHKYFPAEYEELLMFSDLRVERFDILLFAYTSAFLSFLALFLLTVVILCVHTLFFDVADELTISMLTGGTLIIPFVLLNLIARYPRTHARHIQIRSLGDIPEILSYLVMYLKLVPNLENSVRFAASESSTTLASDLRKLVWDMEIRVYHGINDALTDFASRWGRWSEYFKRSLHLIRSSLLQKDEASRIITLDRALDVSLEGTKETMNQFANRLHQPTVILYSIGIMIPLSLVAMLPAAGLVGIQITIMQMCLLYDVLLPLFILLYTRKILLSRPAAFHPSAIPATHPDLRSGHKKKHASIAIVVGCCIASPGLVFLAFPFFFSSETSVDLIYFIGDPRGLNAFFPMTLFFILASAITVSLYCLKVYHPYKKIRDEIKQMEQEFSDALYILGKRLSEEKSPEESFSYAACTMQGSRISEVFRQTSYNLIAMHTNLYDALYSKEYGSLTHVYSDRIKAIFCLFVEGTKKSQRAVSISLIRIADHLKQLQDVEKKITDMLYELTTTLRSTVTLFAPLIAGVTLSITVLISHILKSFTLTNPSEALNGLPLSVPGLSQTFMMENIRPEYFVLVIGIYLMELVVLLTWFTNGLSEGDDKATFMYSLGRTMPVSIGVFTVTILLGQYFFSQIVPLR